MTRATWVLAIALLGSAGASAVARAEQGEKSVGLEAALLVPGFESEDATAFALATWSLDGTGQYGVSDDLFALMRFTFAAFDGAVASTETVQARPISGQLHFAATQLHLELGARYKLCAGYNLAPYVEVAGGFLWTAYRNQDLTNDAGQSYGIAIANRGAGEPTIAVGVAADYRVLNMLFVGIAFRYVQGLGGMYTRYISMPVQFSYYW